MFKTLPLVALLGLTAFAQNDQNTISANVAALTGAATGATKAYRFNTLLKLASDTGLVDALNTANITLFAPTDDAFKVLVNPPADTALVRDILTYHVTPGSFPAANLVSNQILPTLMGRQGSPYVQFTDAKTTQVLNVMKGTDGVTVSFGLGKAKVIDSIPSANGIIHVLGDTVLFPPKKVSDTAVAAKLMQLVGALTKAKLVETVDTAKSITVFAPTDAAFAAIKDTVDKLTDAQLQEVLSYHIVPTVAYSTGLPASLDAPTLVKDAKVSIKNAGNGVMVNDAKVIMADVMVNSGVVHVIDKVLIPPSLRTAAAAPAPALPKSDASNVRASIGMAAAVAAAGAMLA